MMICILVCIFLCSSSTLAVYWDDPDIEGEMVSVKQKAEYHLKELEHSFARLTHLRHRSRRSTRSETDDRQASAHDKNDFLFDSLLNFCQKLQTFDGGSSNSSSSVEEEAGHMTPDLGAGSPNFYGEDDEAWFQPEVRPIGVSALRHGDQVHLSFLVKHSTPARVNRFAGFDYEIKDLEGPSEGSQVTEVKFDVDTKTYCEKGYELDNQFTFEKIDSVSFHASLWVDVCRYDKFQNTSESWDERDWETRPGVIHENITLPRLQMGSDFDHYITVNRGRNESFDMKLEITRDSTFSLYGLFYDKRGKNIVENHLFFDTHTDNFTVRTRDSNSPNMAVEVLGSAATGEENDERETIDLRLTLLTASGQVTGKVYVMSTKRVGSYYERTVVRRVTLGQVIYVRRAKKRTVFPRKKLFMQNADRYLCNKEGNIHREQFERNCTLWCSVTGRDLKAISIYKKDSFTPVYRSMNMSLPDRLFARVDVGMATPDIEGAYVCEVKHGKSFVDSDELMLYTSGFPKIITNLTSAVDLGNGTGVITCAAKGMLPMNLSVNVYNDHEELRLDNKSYSVRHKTETDSGAQLTVALPIKELQYPRNSVSCRASSERGDDSNSIYLPGVIKDHNPYRAKIVPEKSEIQNLGNGTTIITCTATGRKPLDMYVSIGGSSKDFRIDLEEGYTRTETPTANGASVVLLADTRSLIRSTSWLYCGATNEFEHDYIQFYLRDYIDWDLKYQ